jgi:hypothetical protein
VLRCEQTYSSAAGPVRVERTLYRQRQEDERALCPLNCAPGSSRAPGPRWPPSRPPGSWRI